MSATSEISPRNLQELLQDAHGFLTSTKRNDIVDCTSDRTVPIERNRWSYHTTRENIKKWKYKT